MVLLKTAQQFIFSSSPLYLCSVLWLISLLKVGVWFIPNLPAYQALALNPFVNPFLLPEQHYLMWSWFTPWLSWALHLNHGIKFLLLLLLCSCSFTWLFMFLVFKILPEQLARSALVLFMVLPVSATAYFWVGMDSVTLLLLLVVFAWPEYLSVSLLGGIFLGMQHFEQAFIGLSALLLASSFNHWAGAHTRYSIKFCLRVLLAIGLGKGLLLWLFQHYGIVVNSGRWYFLRHYLPAIVSVCFFHLYEIIWAILGLGWLIALRYVDYGRQACPFFVGLLCLTGLVFLVGDHARVMAITTFPLVLAYWLLNRDFLAQLPQSHIALIFLIWLVVPWFWFWNAERGSVLFFDIGYLLHHVFGWFKLPADPYLWPF